MNRRVDVHTCPSALDRLFSPGPDVLAGLTPQVPRPPHALCLEPRFNCVASASVLGKIHDQGKMFDS